MAASAREITRDGTVLMEQRTSAVPSPVPSQALATPGVAGMERFSDRQPRDVRAHPRITRDDDRSIRSIPILHKDINMMTRNAKRNASGTVKSQCVPAGHRYDRAGLVAMAEASVPTYPNRDDLLPYRKARVAEKVEQLEERFAWAAAGSDRVRNRVARIERLATRFGWGDAEMAVVERLIRAVENGDCAGGYVPAQNLIEKVDGTRKSHDMIGGYLDSERELARWYAALRADWTAREVPWWGMVLVLVCGFDIKRAETAAGRRKGYLASAIRDEIACVKAALDKAGAKMA